MEIDGPTPDTIPSLTELSGASTDRDEVSRADRDEVTRILFPTPMRGDPDAFFQSISDDDYSDIDYSAFHRAAMDHAHASFEGNATYESDDLTYSHTTAQGEGSSAIYYDERSAQGNRIKDDRENNDDVATFDDDGTQGNERSRDEETRDTYSFSDASEASISTSREYRHTVWPTNYFPRLSMMAKAAEDAISCHDTFVTAPTDVMRHFFDFRGTQPTPPQSPMSTSGTTQVTEVTSNQNRENLSWTRKIESLQRECKTLKEIIDGDSKHILRLKAEIESFRNFGGSTSCIDVLEKDIQDLRQREKTLLQTVEALHSELNNGNLLEMQASEFQINEIQRLQVQCQIFSFQIVELEKENLRLTKENEALRREISSIERSVPATYEINPSKVIETTPVDVSLRTHVTSLVHRFSQMEEYMERREIVQDEQSRTLQALESIEDTSIPFVYSNSDVSSPDMLHDSAIVANDRYLLTFACSHDEDVEVTLDGLIIATSRNEDSQNGNSPEQPLQKPEKPRASFCCFESCSE
jgi:hypothetical protein